jgi:hypothetical protein
MLKHLAVAAALTLTAGIAAGQTIDRVVPVAGTGPGANGSMWQSELTLHNVSVKPIVVHLGFHDGSGLVSTADVEVAPRATVALDDVVHSQFGVVAGTGAITIDTDDAMRGKLVVTSFTINRSAGGDFGQDIPALDFDSALHEGDLGVIPGPSSVLDSRFNFGLFTTEETTIEWRLVRQDGSPRATVQLTYDAGVQIQYNGGVGTLFGASPADSDVVHAFVRSGSVFLYGSIVNQMTGDPSYVPGVRSRENFAPELLGIDIDRDGTVDIFDADHDGILDQTIDVAVANFPSYLRIIAVDAENDPVTLEILSDVGAHFVDDIGTFYFTPSGALKGTMGALMIRATDGRDFSDFTIPVRYR